MKVIAVLSCWVKEGVDIWGSKGGLSLGSFGLLVEVVLTAFYPCLQLGSWEVKY